MPPKKAAAAKAPAANENGEAKFGWTPENERRLLILAIRSSTGTADYHQFLKAMPTGLSYEGLRQKFQKFKREQKAIYEEMGWKLNDSCPISTTGEEKPEKSTTASNKKRTVSGEDEDEDEEPVEKPAAKKTRGKKVTVEADEDGGNEVPEKPARKHPAKKQAASAASNGDGEDATEKPVKKARGRPKKAVKVEEEVQEKVDEVGSTDEMANGDEDDDI